MIAIKCGGEWRE